VRCVRADPADGGANGSAQDQVWSSLSSGIAALT
jgi:hypothetical protein